MLSLMRIRLVGIALLFSAGVFNGFSAQPESSSPADEYDVFLLIGQSNMAGTVKMKFLASDTTEVIPGVWLLNDKDRPEPALNPLNRYSTVSKGRGGICPGTAFSEKVAARTGRKILLVMNALGGSEIEQWLKTADNVWTKGSKAHGKLQLYAEAVRRTKEAQKYGTLKGIIWHQGEGNSGASKVGLYPEQLQTLVRDLRADLNAPDVPFIAGELSYLRSGGKGSTAFNEMIRTISTFIPHSGWVSAEGLATVSEKDLTHFDREGQLMLGERYADRAIQLCYPAKEQPSGKGKQKNRK